MRPAQLIAFATICSGCASLVGVPDLFFDPDGAASVTDASGLADGSLLDGGGTSTTPDGSTNEGTYFLNIPQTQILADGLKVIPILAVGKLPDGGPALTEVAFTVEPSVAGKVNPTATTLAATGSTVQFTPCSSAANPDCIKGPIEVRMTRVSAPEVILARSPPITLLAQGRLGDPTPCLMGGNIVYFAAVPDGGSNGISTTPLTIGPDASTTMSSAQSSGGGVDVININADGVTWSLEFSTQKLNAPMTIAYYEGAHRFGFANAGQPALSVTGMGRGCNESDGGFQVYDLSVSGGEAKTFTATFEQYCDAQKTPLRGCVHVDK